MYKNLLSATLLSTALLAAPVSQAASYQDRAMTTGAVVGATTGAVVGSNNNQAVEGAIFGAVLGTIAGAVIASQAEPVTVVHTRPVVSRVYYPRTVRHVYYHPRPVVKREVHVYKMAPRHIERSHHVRADRDDRRIRVAHGYGNSQEKRWNEQKRGRNEMRKGSERRDHNERNRNNRDHRS